MSFPNGFSEWSRLGEGSFSEVYKAYKNNHKKWVAIKKIPGKYFDPQEIITMLRCKHENIIKLLDYIPYDHHHWIVLEYCSGGSVADKMPCSETQLKNIVTDTLTGLKYLHEKQYVHRDIKPENILIHSSGKYKLSDFGTCKNTEESDAKIKEIGTYYYMSPEIIASDGSKYDCKVDIWSLGVTIYQLATNSYPFYHQLLPQLVQKIQYESPTKNSKFKEFNPALWNLIEQCLEKKASDRASAAELLEHQWFTSKNKSFVLVFCLKYWKYVVAVILVLIVVFFIIANYW
eukprot:270676_1